MLSWHSKRCSPPAANDLALASLASMAYNLAGSGTSEEKRAALEEARQWNQRRIESDDKNAEPYYYLGMIAWAQAFGDIQSARIKAGMPAGDPGPLTDTTARAELRAKYEETIQGGFDALKRCLELDKRNDDAMAYTNLLYRIKAALEDSADDAKADMAQAEDWSHKSLEMKRLKAESAAKPPQQ